MKKILFCFLLLILILPLVKINSQTKAPPNPGNSVFFDMSGFPQWAKDLRRGEIITFGAFPFTYFFTSLVYDTYRCANNGWDTRYAPWPVKSAGAVELSQSEHFATLGVLHRIIKVSIGG